MSYRLNKLISSASVASIMLIGTIAASADSMSPYLMSSEQTQQVLQQQDQTQFRNRQRLESRINGNGYGDTEKQRNRYQYREQRHHGAQTMSYTQKRTRSADIQPSGSRMAGSGGRGRR